MILTFFLTFAFANSHFHNAPETASKRQNPFAGGGADAIRSGAELFRANCATCHGHDAKGAGNIPDLTQAALRATNDGELFWFITNGSPKDGMPPATQLDERQRWQVVTFLKKSKPGMEAASNQASKAPHSEAPLPPAPFSDYRSQNPGVVHKILPSDLPDPAQQTSVGNGPAVVPRPAKAWPKVPAGYKVQLYADHLENPRLLRTAPNGDIFLAESSANLIRVFRGIDKAGKAKLTQVFTTDVKRPYGIAFYPNDSQPKWVYIGNTGSVVRFLYHSGDLKAAGPAQEIIKLPEGSGHWTRDLAFSADGKQLFVAVGSHSNVDDPDTTPEEMNRAAIWVMKPDGSDMKIFASGVRNAGGGLAIQPSTGRLWCSVNERDGLGDNLVSDYITHVEEGGFYGWPWWYIGGHQDPRHVGKHSELKARLLNPDVLLQAHNASLQLAFYKGKALPFNGDIFAAQHGSWNRSVRTGYEVIRVPMHGGPNSDGSYQDFMTGFVVDDEHVWGRPVGVTEAEDGSLLVSDDGSNSIWRVIRAK
jgi:glucose/arabinose dehydrogenase/cytochrome c5